jgi:hypothetical protein
MRSPFDSFARNETRGILLQMLRHTIVIPMHRMTKEKEATAKLTPVQAKLALVTRDRIGKTPQECSSFNDYSSKDILEKDSAGKETAQSKLPARLPPAQEGF